MQTQEMDESGSEGKEREFSWEEEGFLNLLSTEREHWARALSARDSEEGAAK